MPEVSDMTFQDRLEDRLSMVVASYHLLVPLGCRAFEHFSQTPLGSQHQALSSPLGRRRNAQ